MPRPSLSVVAGNKFILERNRQFSFECRKAGANPRGPEAALDAFPGVQFDQTAGVRPKLLHVYVYSEENDIRERRSIPSGRLVNWEFKPPQQCRQRAQ